MFSEKKLEYNTVQLDIYKEEYIYAWWIIYIYAYKKAYLAWKINATTKNVIKIW